MVEVDSGIGQGLFYDLVRKFSSARAFLRDMTMTWALRVEVQSASSVRYERTNSTVKVDCRVHASSRSVRATTARRKWLWRKRLWRSRFAWLSYEKSVSRNRTAKVD